MAETVRITRLPSTDEGTFGRLTYNDFVVFTLELPWRDNAPNISCIPKGVYNCHWTKSERFKRMMYLIDGVKGRAGVRIHAANFAGDDSKGFKRQLNGCLSLGLNVGQIEGQRALLLSKPAVRKFEDLLKGKSFVLEIV